MLRKKMMAAVLLLLLVVSVGTGVVYAQEVYTGTQKTNLVLEEELPSGALKAVAGGKVHMSFKLRLKEGFCLEPEFFLKAEEGSVLSFANLKVSNREDFGTDLIFIDTDEYVTLEYDVLVDDFAKIGRYTYEVSYNIPEDFYEEDGQLEDGILEPGSLKMEVFVINEKIPPQISVVQGSEHFVKAGETVELKFSVENQGELMALDTYVEAEYSQFDRTLIPVYSPLKRKVGTMPAGDTKEVTVTYKIAEDADTQMIKLPINVSYKLENGNPGSYVAYIYLYVQGMETEKTEDFVPIISDVKQSVEKPKAGEYVTLSFVLENRSNENIPNVRLDVKSVDSGFSMADSDPYIYIGTLYAGEQRTVEINMLASEDIAEGTYVQKITCHYLDNASYDLELRIKNVTNPAPKLVAPYVKNVKQSLEQPMAGEKLTVSFELVNDSDVEIREAKVLLPMLGETGFLPTNAEPYVNVGTIPAGSKKTVELDVRVGEKIAEGFQQLSIEIEYLGQTNNGQYVKQEEPATLNILNVKNPSDADSLVAPYVKNVKQSLEQPIAGEKLTISFDLINDSQVEIKDAKVLLPMLSESGFLPTSAEPYVYVGTIPANSKKTVKLNLKVGEKITGGFNQLDIGIEYFGQMNGSYVKQSETATLYILNVKNPVEEEVTISRPKLMVSNFYTDVEEVKAGNIFDFTFEILNTNESIDAKNIKVTVSGASNAFSVTAGGNSFFVNSIKAQETAPITINLKASAAATTGAYPIQIKIEYEYEGMVATATYNGEVVEEEILLQVKENLRPSVENIYVGSWDTPMVNQATVMNFEFYNMGKSMLNNTYVTIEGDFMLANGSNSYYIGNISAGMPEYIEFDVVPLVEGNAVGKMIIHMEDSNGDEVTMEKEFTAYVMGEMAWDNMYYPEDGNTDFGYPDASMPVDGTAAQEPILPLWMFLCIQGAILVVVIPATRAIRLAAYRRKIKQEDSI